MKLLYLCTHNACRSILCEVITRDLAGDQIEAASAGSHPAGKVHPQTLIHLEKRGYPTANLQSKGFAEVAGFTPDVLITVCDQAAQEPCPVWLGSTVKAHWGLPDPTRSSSSAATMETTFDAVTTTIVERIQRLLTQTNSSMSPAQLANLLNRIGEEHHGLV